MFGSFSSLGVGVVVCGGEGEGGGEGGQKAIYNPCLPALQTIHSAHIRKMIMLPTIIITVG